MAAAERASAGTQRRLGRSLRESQPDMDIAAMTAAEMLHGGILWSAATSVNRAILCRIPHGLSRLWQISSISGAYSA